MTNLNGNTFIWTLCKKGLSTPCHMLIKEHSPFVPIVSAKSRSAAHCKLPQPDKAASA